MRKGIASVLLLLSLLACFSVTVFAAGSRIRDDADFLTSAEESALSSKLSEAETEIGYGIYIYTYNGIIFGGSESYLLGRLDLDHNDDAIVLFVYESSGTYYYELYTYGDAADLSDGAVDAILDDSDVYGNLKSGRIAEGLTAFAEALPREKKRDEQSNLVGVIVVSVIIALAAGGATVGCIIYKYKKKLKSPIYPLSKFANMDLEYSSDSFIGSTVTRTRVNRSSGSSGRSGGGGFRGKR